MNSFETTGTFPVEFGEIIETGDCEVYEGEYTVTPRVSAQLLETQRKMCRQDIQIRAIPYYEVENQNHGNTVIIGG